MSINFCTLTNSSVDTFCGNRRSIVLNGLLQKKYPPPVQGGGRRVLRDTFAEQRPDLIVREEDRPQLVFEQPFITVEVSMNGITMAQTLDAQQRLDFVTVTDLKVNPVTASPVDEALEVAVNIADISIRKL